MVNKKAFALSHDGNTKAYLYNNFSRKFCVNDWFLARMHVAGKGLLSSLSNKLIETSKFLDEKMNKKMLFVCVLFIYF